MFSIFESAVDLAVDAARIVTAPAEIAIDLADAALKPVAEVAQELVADVKSLKD